MTDTPAFRIVVPGPPRGVERARSRIVRKRDGSQFVSTYTASKTRNEQAVIRQMASDEMGDRPPFDGALELRLGAHLPIPQSFSKKRTADALAGRLLPTTKPDFDNIAKFVDALKGIAFRDDNQIADAHIWKRYSDRPRFVVEIRPL